MIRLDYRDARPIYEQVKDGLRRLMVTGVLAPGEKLPSVRSLAMDLAINPNTIQRAYAQLEMEGYVYSVAGRGTFVAEGQEQNLVRRPGGGGQGASSAAGAAGAGHDGGRVDRPVERRKRECLRQKRWSRALTASGHWTAPPSPYPRGRYMLVGPNGAGKSTIIRHFTGVYLPTAANCCWRALPFGRTPMPSGAWW